MDITIRKANAKDFSSVVEMIHEFASFQQTPEKVFITEAQMETNQDLFNCLVAETDDKKVVGFVSFFFAFYSWSGRAIYLDDLYVREEYRKKGVGKKLLMMVIDIAKQTDCKKARWQVSNWNTNAIEFYKSIGAEINTIEINCDFHF